MLTFPSVFAPQGLLGSGGPQSTPWLYILWHAGFTGVVIAYTFLKDSEPTKWRSHGSIRTAIVSIGLITALVCGATILVTAGDAFMPRLMLDSVRLGRGWLFAAALLLALIILALILLWLRYGSVLDLGSWWSCARTA
jgi:hypothetical protein